MNVKHKIPIIIAGGGIGGMTMALALAQKGIASLVLEQSPELRIAGAGIHFCPNTYKALSFIGLEKAIREISFISNAHCYYNAITGKPYLTIPLGNELIERFNHPFGSIHRQDLLRLLVAECQKFSLITMLSDSKVVDVGEEGDDTVFVKTSSGKVYKGEALIGCDGLWSIVRKAVVKNDQIVNSGQIVYRGVVPREVLPKEFNLDQISHFVMPNAYTVYYPIGTRGQIHISAYFKTHKRVPDLRETEGNAQELFQAFENALPEVQQLVRHVDTSVMRIAVDREPIREWSVGRMVLLGDAAHPTHPALGSGAGMAIEDALVLSQNIHDCHGDYHAAFQAYQQERYLRTAYVQIFSRAHTEVHYASGIHAEVKEMLLSKLTKDDIYRWYSYLYDGIEPRFGSSS